jgi:flagellin
MASAFAINTNIQAQQAFQNLQETNDQLSQRRERLTTGLRINEASDDAAGFQIANQLEAKTGAQGQALRNIGDAKSALSTAEGALDSQLSILQSAKEKATQAANGSLSQDERNAIGRELNQLGQEINDIQENATFNGEQLLSGGSGGSKTFDFQTGASSSGEKGQFSVDLKNSSTKNLGVAADINLGTLDGKKDAVELDQGDFTNTTGAGNIDARLTDRTGTDGGGEDGTVQADLSGGDLAGDLEGGKFEITASQDGAADDSKLNFRIEDEQGNVTKKTNVTVGSSNTITLESDGSGNEIDLEVGTAFQDTGGTADTGTFSVEVKSDRGLGDKLIGTSDVDDARSIISDVDDAIDTATKELANLGAAQNRLSFKESNLETSRTNLNSARSRIEDADFAQTQTQVAKLQVQQQSGTAQLAQANASGQSVLSLLSG